MTHKVPRIVLSLSLVAIITLVAACSGGTQSPAPSSAGAPAAKAEPIKLKLASAFGPQHPVTLDANMYADRVKELSKGQVLIDVFPSEQLTPARNAHEAIRTGSLDMAILSAPYFSGVVPLSDVYWLPLLWTYENTIPALKGGIAEIMGKEYEAKLNAKILAEGPGSTTFLVTVNKPVRKLEDMKGLNIRGAGGPLSKAVTAAGAAVTSVTGAEVYTALERKTVDGSFWTMGSYYPMKIWEVAKYYNDLPIALGLNEIVINVDKFKSLPKDAQDTLVNARDAEPAIIDRIKKWEADASQELKKSGMEVISFDKNEQARWQKAMTEVWDDYIKRTGDPGKKMVEILQTAK